MAKLPKRNLGYDGQTDGTYRVRTWAGSPLGTVRRAAGQWAYSSPEGEATGTCKTRGEAGEALWQAMEARHAAARQAVYELPDPDAAAHAPLVRSIAGRLGVIRGRLLATGTDRGKEAGGALDRALDAIDSAVRTLESEDPYPDEDEADKVWDFVRPPGQARS